MGDHKAEKSDSQTSAKDSVSENNEVPVRYLIECWDEIKKETLLVDNDDKPFDIQLKTVKGPPLDQKKQTEAFRVILEVDGYDLRQGRRDMYGIFNKKTSHKQATGALEDASKGDLCMDHLEITGVFESKIEIRSDFLLEALREVVDYYPRLVLPS
jgi:hypothetical protein